jgi:hypothetical protein
MSNAPHQPQGGIVRERSYDLAVVEFDDQGRCYDRAQMDAVATRLDDWSGTDAIILAFAHGWKHDGRSDDENLEAFQRVLTDTANREAQDRGGRPVLGVFVAWRGLSFYDRWGLSQNVTFWSRQEAARRVAVGSVRELFGRFRRYRNHRVDAGGAPLLVLVGHSFGGLIVYSALAQSLIEAATSPLDEITTRFADLVLLVNPAMEAARYLPVTDLLHTRIAARAFAQPPIFVSVTATNDWATGVFFPLGNVGALLTESWRGSEERDAMIRTLGHVPWLTTHDLRSGTGGHPQLTQVHAETQSAPFWVVRADPTVVDGHSGIFKDVFLRFLAGLVFEHVAYSRRLRRKPGESSPPDRPH